jgi:hypothetical protein
MKGFTQRMIVLGVLLLGLGSVLASHSYEPSTGDGAVADKSVADGSMTGVRPDPLADAAVGPSSPLVQGLTLPYAGSVSSVNAAFLITNTGGGWAGAFQVNVPAGRKGQPALDVRTNAPEFAGVFQGGKGVRIAASGSTALQVTGGTKSAVVATHQGARALYTEEATEVWFADYGFGRLHNGRATIQIDPLFAETVNLDEPYHVFVQVYGDAELYVSQRTPIGFEVRLREGDLNVEFSYRLVAKRWGFEQQRLEHAPWADDDSSISQEKLAKQKAKHQPTLAEMER